jgi:hypothetical protein
MGAVGQSFATEGTGSDWPRAGKKIKGKKRHILVERSMWTLENRAKYNRDHLRYPSDLTDDEWAHVEPLISPAKPGGGKRRARGDLVLPAIGSITHRTDSSRGPIERSVADQIS